MERWEKLAEIEDKVAAANNNLKRIAQEHYNRYGKPLKFSIGNTRFCLAHDYGLNDARLLVYDPKFGSVTPWKAEEDEATILKVADFLSEEVEEVAVQHSTVGDDVK